MKKILKVLIIFLIMLLIGIGTVYSVKKIYNRLKGNLNINTFNSQIMQINSSDVWVGSFQIAWNEFIEKIVQEDVEFEDGDSELIEELNQKNFTKGMLSEEDYYIKVDKVSPEIRTEIKKDLENKFQLNSSNLLKDMEFEENDNSYIIYSILVKKFEFLNSFDILGSGSFSNSNEKVKYFGIDSTSDEMINNNVEVLFYNSKNEFAVKLNTNQNEEMIIYKNNDEKSFDGLYKKMIEQALIYEGNKEFTEHDEIRIPFVKVDASIKYDEICNRKIKRKNGMYIANAFQNVKFSLNEKGCNLTSEASVNPVVQSSYIDTREFFANDTFVIFLKESNKEKPYFALRVNDTEVLEIDK